MKKALITSITGQDGAYLAKFLLDKGYEVYGTYRRLSTPNFWRLQYLDNFESVNLIPSDLVDAGSMVEAVKIPEPTHYFSTNPINPPSSSQKQFLLSNPSSL